MAEGVHLWQKHRDVHDVYAFRSRALSRCATPAHKDQKNEKKRRGMAEVVRVEGYPEVTIRENMEQKPHPHPDPSKFFKFNIIPPPVWSKKTG